MKELIGPKELARRLSVPLSWVYDRTRKNGPDRIPSYKLGKYQRFDVAEVEAWLAERARDDHGERT